MRLRFPVTVAICAALVCADAQAQKPKPAAANTSARAVRFQDIAARAGLDMLNVFGGDDHKEFLIETTGNGAAIFDYDNDGWPDIYLPNGSRVEGFPKGQEPTGHLYHNNRDGTFTDLTVQAGLGQPGWAQGTCVGDYDNDGNLDLLVTYWGQNILYRNNGHGGFTDVTSAAGLKTPRDEWSTGCSFVDYDRDGKADIFITRYVDFSYDTVPRPGHGQYCQWKGLAVLCGPRGLKTSTNALYHNNGDGTFSDVSRKSGITNVPACYGLTSLTGDFDQDGWPDIYVACDSTPNILYHNDQGTFTDIANQAGVAYNDDGLMQAGMGLSAGDFRHQGVEDIVKTNFSNDTPTLYLNRGNNSFDDSTHSSGLGLIRNWLGWGVQFYDFDNSGWPGILIGNGHSFPEVDGKNLGTSYREPKVLYSNLRDGKLKNITPQAGAVLSERHSARGLALGDLFNDGHVEALVNNMNEKPSLYYNFGPAGNFVSLRLIGVKSNRAALGALVTLEQGTSKYAQEVRSGDGYISQSDLRIHFGLGEAAQAEKIVIRWPSGLVETLRNLAANRYYVVREGSGIENDRTCEPGKPPFAEQRTVRK